MWHLTKIHAENLCAFQRLDWEIPQNVTTLVFGDNLDNDSQRSNGAGKSALIEAIAIALTGEPLRKVNTDEIINDSQSEAVVSATLFNETFGWRMTINRRLSRKQPQLVQISKQTGLYDVDTEDVKRPTVADYNTYILEQLGLSKDDILSSFILSRHKYVSFLSSKDSDKKVLINRFSNGVMVDEAIEALQADIEPARKTLNEVENHVSYLKGTVNALTEQVENMVNSAGEIKMQREVRMQQIASAITSHREAIRGCKNKMQLIDLDWADVDKLESEFNRIEDSDSSLEDSYNRIASIWKEELLGPLENYGNVFKNLESQISYWEIRQHGIDKQVREYQKQLADLQAELDKTIKEYEALQDKTSEAANRLREQIVTHRHDICYNETLTADLLIRREKAHKFIADLQLQLAGSVTCPKCGYQWLTNTDKSVEDVRHTLELAGSRLDEIEQEIRTAREATDKSRHAIQEARIDMDKLDEGMSVKSRAVNEARRKTSDATSQHGRYKAESESALSELRRIQTRLTSMRAEMFNNIYSTVDTTVKKFDSAIGMEEMDIASHEAAIESLQHTLEELKKSTQEDLVAPLRKSLTEKQEELEQAVIRRDEASAVLGRLTIQETRFNEFKTYLANSKIAALSQITNEFLERIGSDIRIAFSGFTVLKSGKIRDKISVSLMRDGIDCGSFGKFSGGERSRAELATILALQKLTNLSCPDGKGLDLLVLDEILEAVDEDGLAAIFDALNRLQLTSVVVSHGNIAENYPHRLIVHKKHSVSFINGNET